MLCLGRPLGPLFLFALLTAVPLRDSAAAPAAGGAALPPPQWVGAAPEKGGVRLTWVWNPAFAAVRASRRDAAGAAAFAVVGETAGNLFLDKDVVAGKAYRYRLVGLGADGREGRLSTEVLVQVPTRELRAPAPPRWEGYLRLENGVALRWAERKGEDVIAYNVYRRARAEVRFQLVGSTRQLSYRDLGLVPGTSYVYALSALDSSFRETPLSEELAVTFEPLPPPAPPERARVVSQWRVRRTRLVAMVAGGDVPFLRPADVAVGPVTGSVYVADSGRNRVFVFSRQGVYQYTVGVDGTGKPIFKKVLGLGVDQAETLYVVDAGAGVVQAFGARQRLGRRFETRPPPGAAATGLIDAAPAPDGELYLVDNLNNRLLITNLPNQAVPFASRESREGGELSAPTFCASDAEGNLYVSEALNGRVQVFSPSGEFVRAFGRSSRGPGGFGRPKGVALGADGEVYVADSWLNTVQVFDRTGLFVAVLGDEEGRRLDLGSPNGVALGSGNRVVIAERLSGRVQIRELIEDAR